MAKLKLQRLPKNSEKMMSCLKPALRTRIPLPVHNCNSKMCMEEAPMIETNPDLDRNVTEP